MIRVIASNFIKSEHIDAAGPLFKEMLAATQKEDGCIEYRLFLKKDEPGRFVFVEEWASQEDLNRHMASEHFKRIIPQIDKFKSKDAEVIFMTEEFK